MEEFYNEISNILDEKARIDLQILKLETRKRDLYKEIESSAQKITEEYEQMSGENVSESEKNVIERNRAKYVAIKQSMEKEYSKLDEEIIKLKDGLQQKVSELKGRIEAQISKNENEIEKNEKVYLYNAKESLDKYKNQLEEEKDPQLKEMLEATIKQYEDAVHNIEQRSAELLENVRNLRTLNSRIDVNNLDSLIEIDDEKNSKKEPLVEETEMEEESINSSKKYFDAIEQSKTAEDLRAIKIALNNDATISDDEAKKIFDATQAKKAEIEKATAKPHKKTEYEKPEPAETQEQDDFSDILEIFNTKPETQRKGVDIDIPFEDKPKKVEATPKYKPLENADSVEEGKFAAPHKTGKRIEPQYEDIIIDEDGISHTDSKILISRIEIDEATGIIRAIDEHDKVIYNKQYEYDVDLKEFILADGEKFILEDEEYQKFRDEKVNKIQDRLIKQYGKEVYDEKFKNIDGRVFDLLFDLKDETLLENYIYSIFEKDETMPFMLNYNLKDIYNTEMSLAQIKAVQEYSKIAYKQNKEMVDIKKDNIFKRTFGRIKKGIKEVINTKLLGSGKVSDERTVDRKNVVNNESEKPKEIKKTREERDDFVYGIQHDSNGNKIDPYAMYEQLPNLDDDFIIADEDDLKLEENSEDKVDDYEDYKF